MILSWPSVQFLPWIESKSKSIPFLIESPCINIFSLAAERTFHARYAVFALETFVTITIQSVDCWVWFAPNKVFHGFLHLSLVSVTSRIASKVQENPWNVTSDHAMPCERFPSPRPAAFQLPTPLGRTEWWVARLDDIGCMFRLEMKVLLGKPRWRQVWFPEIMAWFPHIQYSKDAAGNLKLQHFRMATLGSSCTETTIWWLWLK